VVSTPSSGQHVDTARVPTNSGQGQALLTSHLAVAMDLITEPWCNSILRAAFLGVRRFDAFQQVLQAPRQTLSLRLAYLVDTGLLRRQPMGDNALRHEYRLTASGKALYAVVLASWAWDRRWGDPLQRMPVRLQHQPCGHAFRPQLLCEHCGDPLTLARMRPVLQALGANTSGARARNSRWRGPAPESAGPPQRDILAVIDDRWSVLVVAAIMLGARQFDELTRSLDISSAVLTRRLQRLCAMEVIGRAPDPQDARRAVYRLEPAGRELFPYVLVLAQWGGTQTRRSDSVAWVHVTCGHPARGRMACSHCRQTLLPQEVVRPSPG
jgi:DNA-binding HxlR family transcriptional regulator